MLYKARAAKAAFWYLACMSNVLNKVESAVRLLVVQACVAWLRSVPVFPVKERAGMGSPRQCDGNGLSRRDSWAMNRVFFSSTNTNCMTEVSSSVQSRNWPKAERLGAVKASECDALRSYREEADEGDNGFAPLWPLKTR